MSDRQYKVVDSFGTFLNSVKQPQQDTEVGGGSMKLLFALESGPLQMPQLLTVSGMPVATFAQTLDTMKNIGLVSLQQAGNAEVAELTPTGIGIAKLAHNG